MLGAAPDETDYSTVSADRERGRRIAAAYMAGPVLDDRARPAYHAFAAETARQFDLLTAPVRRGGLGVEVRVSSSDPYPDASSMARDLRRRRLLWVYSTAASGSAHPLLSDEENDMFRAVHDAFGHAAIGRAFDADGEEAAWRSHYSMYSPLAGWAMTTETRGQNCAMLHHFGGRRFPEQKAFLLPPEIALLF
ncbi:hypothetical protein [Micromonospora zhanjiangensis]|uniref:Uncharacterized protein n=1 Tax=Micromonospora zhanjiangensis TaxID=1522057 RepID=A0ABV8KJH3_9ACTN